MEKTEVKLTANGRTVEFDLRFDPRFLADCNTRLMLTQLGGVEPEVVHLMMRVVQEGDLVVDAGANIGFFTLLLSKLVGPTGKVLAFEPGCNNLPALKENLRLNKVQNVEVIEQPLWETAEEVTLYLSYDSGNNSLARHEDTRGRQTMMATTLWVEIEKYLDQHDIPKLIKIDVEGAEQKILASGNFLARYVVCELNEKLLAHFGSTQRSLRRMMHDQAYDCFLLHPNGSLPTKVPPTTRIEPRFINCNILFSESYRVGEAWPTVQG